MIVKVQISDVPSPPARLLVYQEGRVGIYEAPINKRMKVFFGYFSGQFKKFYHAELNEHGHYVLGEEAPEQDW